MPLSPVDLQKALTKFKDLPTLPNVVAKVMQVVANPMSTAESLNQVISLDQALTFKVLRLANSAYYGFPKEITHITQAVTILGFNSIRNLALSVSVHKMLFTDQAKDHFSHREFWKHCVAVAVCSRILARMLGYKSEENAFTAGLLHDIGKNVLDRTAHDEFSRAVDMSHDSSRPLWQCEQELLGIDHAALGARLAETWNLSHDLRIAIERQHYPSQEGAPDPLVAIVHAANQICRSLALGSDGDGGPSEVDAEVATLLKLDKGVLELLAAELELRMKEAEEFLRFSKGG